MQKKSNTIKAPILKQRSVLKKRAPIAVKESPTNPTELFQRIQIATQRQARNLISRILKMLLNGILPESRAREARFYVAEAIQLNREIQLRARLDKICEVLKIEGPALDDENEDPDVDADIPIPGVAENATE